ncbi:MAG: flagellar biosynthesis protein FlhA [Deltaproteobacteria bacterium]|nr:flagellar biosynthesis protein FlhA [Deltaproteobacteria bacterium]
MDLVGRVANREVIIAIVLVSIVGLLIIPLSPMVLDFLLATSIALSLVVFLCSFYVRDPVEFSVFPVLLLLTTVFRLALNISSTRLILSLGNQGTLAAGHIIETFGEVVAAGNFAVGMVIFIILIIINFVVVTKGAGRIAEVAARFTLDAMPGKQMAIDADLNAGLIGEVEARERRSKISIEADFHGAMDGASKFIRGDAIAGMLITGINLVGGLFIGMVQYGMTAGEAARTYSVLTIGDGLVSQVPALVISVSAGMLVTRIASDTANLQSELGAQLFGSSKVLWLAAGILLPFSLVDGLTLPFLLIGAGVSAAAMWGRLAVDDEVPSADDAEEAPTGEGEDPIEPVEVLEMEVGFDIIPLVDERRGGELMDRIARLRRQFAKTLGIVVPPIHVRDNLRLDGIQYAILLRGTEVANGELRPGYMLAIDPGGDHPEVPGIPGKEPAFGLDALWVKEEHQRDAEAAGYTVVDPATVLSTHLSEIIKKHAPEFIGRQEVQQLVDRVARTHPKVVDDLVPNMIPLGTVLTVLRNLLREEVSVRDLLTVLETLADAATISTDADFLTERVRQSLGRQIAAQHQDAHGTIHYISFAQSVESMIREGLKSDAAGSQLVLDPSDAQGILRGLTQEVERHAELNVMPVVLSAPAIRGAVRRLIERVLPQVAVLSPNELTEQSKLRRLATVGLAEA